MKKTHHRQITILMVVMALTMAYLISAIVVQQRPYLRTEFSVTTRYWILFPLLFGAFCWLIFFQRYKTYNGKTAFQYQTAGKNGFRKYFEALLAIVSAVFMFGFLSWSTIAFPGTLAFFLAKEPFSRSYHIKEISIWGKRVGHYYDVSMIDIDTKELVNLSLPTIEFNERAINTSPESLENTAVICTEGLTSVFGTVIQKVSDCRGSRIDL